MTNVLKKIEKRSRFLQRTVLLTFLLNCFFVSAQQQKTVVKGKVLDENTNEVIIGAIIKVKESEGKQSGTVSDANGKFSLDVKSLPVTLTINFIGYRGQETDIYEYSEPITIFLPENLNTLNEVVVVGYGTQKRKELTGAVASVPKNTLLQITSSFDNALGGAIAGLNVTQSSGQPGASSSIRIRGGNSINGGNNPLYVIDGFSVYNDNSATSTGAGRNDAGLNPLSSINSADIESIEVLKDASATAIYGSRGANGVIIITTKKGKKGSNHINYQSTFGWQQISKRIDVLNGSQWATLYNELQASEGKATAFTQAQIDAFGKGTDWQDAALRTGPTEDHQISFTGGDEKTRYAVSGNYFKQEGIVLNTDFTRFSARINLDRDVFKNLKIGVNVSGSSSKQNGLSNVASSEIPNTWAEVIRAVPIVPIYNSDGSFNYTNPYAESANILNGVSPNPISDLLNTVDETKNNRLLGNFYIEYKVIPSLTAKINVGTDFNNVKQNYYAPSYTSAGLQNIGYASVGNKEINSSQAEFTLNYEKKINKNNYLNVLVGYTTQKTDAEYVTASSKNFSNDATTYNSLQSASITIMPTSGAYASVLNSYLGRINYSYLERYNLTATLRADGSSRFAKNNKWGYFPSIGLSWNINEEPFLKGNKNISNLKLRLSAGITGNQEIGDYKYESTINPGVYSYSFNGTFATAYIPSNLENQNLKWEKTAQYDAGLDWGLWKDRLNIVFDAYYKKTTDLLLNVPVETTSGYTTVLKNIGSVSNKGLELELSGKIINRKKFNWTSSFNIAKNLNKVENLGGVDYFIPAFTSTDNLSQVGMGYAVPLIVKVGQPIGSFYGYKFAGVVQTGDDLTKVPKPSWFTSNVQAGDPKYVNQNTDNVITEADKVVLGNTQPDFTYGFTNTLTYKNVDLSFSLQGSYGNKIYNALRQRLEKTTIFYNSSADVANRWTENNPSNEISRATDATNIVLDSRYVEDASYLRFKNITLGYTYLIKNKNKEIIKFKIFVSAQNLFTITNYSGNDPEASRYGGDETNDIYQGIDFGTYPSSKSYSVGINIIL